MVTPPRQLDPTHSARHLFAVQQRTQRQQHDMSLDRLADIVNYSKTQLHGVEMAERLPFPPLPGKLDVTFGTQGLFEGLWQAIQREQFPDRYRRFMELAGQATDIYEYAGHVVPGLLQTEAYARALCRAWTPEASESEIDERVVSRMSRQDRLTGDSSPVLWALLDEVVLRRPVGGSAVMHEQLAKLLPLVDTLNTTIQVLPFSHGEHALLGASLTLLTLPNRSTVAYLEGIDDGNLIETPQAVRRRQRAYDRLRAYALAPRESEALIRAAMEDYTPCVPPPN
jgi:uncharacterized protein DUF5753